MIFQITYQNGYKIMTALYQLKRPKAAGRELKTINNIHKTNIF